MAIFNEDAGNELIVGSNKDDTIKGRGGDDTILGADGDDVLRGNRGDDSIEGGEGEDTLRGGRGDDTLIGDTGNDRVIGGRGDDRLIWNNGDGSDVMRGGRGFDVVEVNGAVGDGDDFELRANGERVEFERLNLGNFVLDVDNVEQFEINGLGGDDTLTVQDLTGTDVQQVIFNGGDGNDSLDASLTNVEIIADGEAGNDTLIGGQVKDLLRGGNDDDTLEGGSGDDTLIGDKGSDLFQGDEGDDRLIWNDGDGSDIMEGGEDFDVTEFNGSLELGDELLLQANGERASFDRLNLVPINLDVNDVEQFEINGLGGDDTLTVQDLTGTDVQQVIFNGGDGNDSLDASLSNVEIIADGGEGDDYLSGSSVPEITDTLEGGDGDDTIVGNQGNDLKIGGDGDDRLIWNNGDGSDTMEGDDGFDVVEVNGAVGDGDDFELRANGERVEFERLNLGNFILDVDNVEQFEINGLGGDDTLTVQDLTGTDVQQVIFNGGDGDDFLDGEETSTQIISEGGVGNDTLISGTADDTLDGGVGDDKIEGEQGNDTMIGGEGNDTLEWDDGDGSDLMSGGTGIDTIEVEGSLAEGDDFVLQQDGEKAIFDRVNLGLFTLTVDTSEIFEVEGEGGNDIFTVGDLSNTDVEKVTFEGGEGNDFLDASLTNVEIIADGGDGDDTLIGGQADDTLIGGNGNNTYTGGEGADVFVVSFDGIDVINDFDSGEGDVLQISMMEFGVSSLDNFSYNSDSKELSYQNNQFAVINTVEPFNIMNDITLVE